MGTTRTQIPETSVDAEGISTVTATRTLADARSGMIYDPSELAAVTPVHLHPLTPGRYLMVFSRRWHDATVSDADPGAYTDYDEDTSPGWAIVESTGARTAPGRTYAVPGPAGRTLTAACSNANTYLYLLSSLSDGGAVIQHFRWSPDRDSMLAVAEETLPDVAADGQTVRFDRGVFISGQHLIVVGYGLTDNKIYLARKPWGRIGTNRVSGKPGGDSIDDPSWRYRSALGWDPDSAALDPFALTTHGPVSTAVYRDRLYLSTVDAADASRTAKVHTKRHALPDWTVVGTTAALGSTADDTYLGGTLQLQQHLRAPAQTLSVPYLTAVKTTSGGADRLSVVWNLLPVIT